MRHRDGEQVRGETLPVIASRVGASAVGFVVEVSPVEVVARVELAAARVGEVDGVVGVHGYENLRQAEQPRENALVSVLLYLVARLAHRHTTALELYMDDRHSVDKEAQVAAAIIQELAFSRIYRLLGNLVATLAAGDFPAVVDLQADLFAEM